MLTPGDDNPFDAASELSFKRQLKQSEGGVEKPTGMVAES
jgi:hypothetical protein